MFVWQQCRSGAKEADDQQVHALFEQHANETRNQYKRLTARLDELGGSTSGMKTALAHMLGMMPKAAQIVHDESERVTQNLIIAYSVENSEVAMYEALAAIAQTADDTATADLARSIQQEEQQTADLVFDHIRRAATRPLSKGQQSEIRSESRTRRAG